MEENRNLTNEEVTTFEAIINENQTTLTESDLSSIRKIMENEMATWMMTVDAKNMPSYARVISGLTLTTAALVYIGWRKFKKHREENKED